MERDPKIAGLIREGGIKNAPSDFTQRVMDQIASAPVKKTYKPLIGKGGQIFIILAVLALIVITAIYAEPGGKLLQPGAFSNLELKIPEYHLNFQFLEKLNFSGGIAAALVALFILVLTDAGLRKRNLG